MFSVKWDAGYLARYDWFNLTDDERASDPFAVDAQLITGLSENELHDRLETTALILTHGESPALDKWRKALHDS